MYFVFFSICLKLRLLRQIDTKSYEILYLLRKIILVNL
jgi:hypothetical protein